MKTSLYFIDKHDIFGKTVTVEDIVEMMEDYASQSRPMNKIVVDDKSTYPPMGIDVVIKFDEDHVGTKKTVGCWQEWHGKIDWIYHLDFFANPNPPVEWSYLPE